MNKIIVLITITFLGFGCRENEKVEPKELRLRYVEDIHFDENIDNPNFSTCNGDEYVKQYFNNSKAIEYIGGKRAIIDIFKQDYIVPKNSQFSGLVRIRFIVDCQGNTGRFRLLSMDDNYKKSTPPKEIADQLLTITKSLNGWKTKTLSGHVQDYYQYLSFKIIKGEIVKILP